MNGVRRFLGSVAASPQQQPENLPPALPKVVPLNFSANSNRLSSSPFSSTPPSPPQLEASPKITPSLNVFKKERSKQGSLSQSAAISPPDDPSGSSPYATPLKSALKSSMRSHAAQKSITVPNSPASDLSLLDSSNSRRSDPGWKRESENLTTRDQLLISLMSSEAVIDCREFNILGTEEVEELKKEHQVLSSRLVALNKKLALETKIRDAALNLSRVNAAHKKVSKQTSEQLDAANDRVEAAQKELWRISDKANDVYRRLMEHRAGVLSYSVRNLEKKIAVTEDSGYDSSNRSTLMTSVSPTSPTIPTKSRFEGAHFFAGHAGAIVPRPKLSAEAALAELTKVEEKLKEAKDQLAAASKKQGDMARDLSMMKLEKQEVETTLGMDLQAAEETIAALEKEIPRLEELNAEVQRLRQEKSAWEMELMQQSPAKEELQDGVSALQLIVQDFGIRLASLEPSLLDYLDAIVAYLQTMHAKLEESIEEKANTKRQLEDEVRMGLDRQEALARELEEMRRGSDTRLRSPNQFTPAGLPSDDGDFNLSSVMSVLRPIWAMLPSPETRAAKLGPNSNKNFRTGSPILGTNVSSLSELDVRSLKILYDARSNGLATSPKPGGEPFSIEAFAQRVQALINDDRSLIERLIRFAQAHDLLKKNAERAQKLAQDGNSALETYQKQVKTLEEMNMSFAAERSAMQEEVRQLTDTIERMTAEKQEVEGRAGEQADQIRQLTEANNSLSAQTLQLAEDAALAPEMVRKQMEGQLSDLKKKLTAAEEEVSEMRLSENSQRIALLDELNTMQTENSNLRAQLRAVKR